MLILSRNIGQSIKIGDDVDITILSVRGNQIRIGINAPKNVSVHREEIYNRIQEQKAHNLLMLESGDNEYSEQ